MKERWLAPPRARDREAGRRETETGVEDRESTPTPAIVRAVLVNRRATATRAAVAAIALAKRAADLEAGVQLDTRKEGNHQRRNVSVSPRNGAR